ncbi:GntR family transcriptional regulator [Streptomyces sp. NPDC002817]|uniref:GntR family transcriptional regulator n=1 Tax=Streptomyces sp. NPDC088357 TaxID=3154655 RepID=UPI003422E36D
MTEAPGGLPKYLTVATNLARLIEAGHYPAGARLPAEPDLAKELDVSIVTLRKGLDVLKANGMIDSRKGSGNYVRGQKPIRRVATRRQSLGAQPERPTVLESDDTQVLDTDTLTFTLDASVPPGIARVLGLDEGGRSFLRTVRYLSAGRPVKLVRTYVPRELVEESPLVHAESAHESIHVALSAVGHAPVDGHEEVSSRMPNTEEAAQLSILPTRAVLAAYRTLYDAAGQVVVVEETVMDSASYVLDYAVSP